MNGRGKSRFLNFIKNLIKPRTKEFSYFPIKPDHFIEQQPPQGKFVRDGNYFEIVVHHIFLRHQREYWIGYQPLGVTLVRSIYGESWEELPFVIGPRLLENLESVQEGDSIAYRNVRVAGPQPYMGDWVRLFTGLWRSPTRDIAKEILAFAETIGGAIMPSQLSTCLTVARPLVQGLETLLGMDKLDLRIGYLVGYSSRPGPSQFKPGYFAMIRASGLDKDRFWVKDDRLYFGSTAKKAKPYTEADYMLFSIKCLEQREDITTFPFYRLFQGAKKKIWEYKDQEAEALLKAYMAELAVSPDFTTTHRRMLILWARAQIEQERALRDGKARGLSDTQLRQMVMQAGMDFVKQAMMIAATAGFSKSVVRDIGFIQTLFERELEPLPSLVGKGVPSDDELAARIMAYGEKPRRRKPKPLELAAALSIR